MLSTSFVVPCVEITQSVPHLFQRALSTRARQSTAALQAQGYMARRHFGSSAVACKAIGYKLADIGEGIAEAEVLQWYAWLAQVAKDPDKLVYCAFLVRTLLQVYF